MTNPFETSKLGKAIENAPMLSANAARLLHIIANPDHDMQEVIRIVKHDAALTARVLKVVNSAVFGLLDPVTTIERGVSYLGERIVVGIALAESTGKLFSKPLDGYEGAGGALWRHDLFTAIASQRVAAFARGECNPGLAFTGGLLHDIGKAILSDFLDGTPSQACADIESGTADSYLAAEQKLAGYDHAEVGLELARLWQLPEALQEVIRFHHHPALAREELRPLVYAVHLGDLLAMMHGLDTGSDALRYPLDEGYNRYFDISEDTLGMLLLEVVEDFRMIEASMTLD